MTERIRFHFDESTDPAVAEGLRRHSVDLTLTRDTGLGGATDADQLAYARQHQRTLFTLDDDFLKLHKAGEPHFGVVYCRSQQRSVGQMIRSLLLIWECVTAEEMINHVEFL